VAEQVAGMTSVGENGYHPPRPFFLNTVGRNLPMPPPLSHISISAHGCGTFMEGGLKSAWIPGKLEASNWFGKWEQWFPREAISP
jgi:hypothetical protein